MEAAEIIPGTWLDPALLAVEHMRASGPGGQNVNKVSTAIRLRLDLGAWPAINEEQRARMLARLRSRLIQDRWIAVHGQRFRSQEQNLEDAYGRLCEILREGLSVPKRRRATKATRGSRLRRLKSKAIRSEAKSLRRGSPE